jgi:hypothetical protein
VEIQKSAGREVTSPNENGDLRPSL